jgi:hypothetical protein
MTRFFLTVGIFLLLLKAFMVHDAHAEAGMIPFDSPIGEIGGRGHWYSLRTMKGADYWTDPAVTSDIRANDDGTYSILGDAPVSVFLVVHPDWYDGVEPWRRAIDWVRQAEQMFRNSGVPVRFVIEGIATEKNMPDTVEEAYHEVNYGKYAERGADLVIGLIPYNPADPYCGVAGIGGRKSVSSCSPKTLAHELGHNFGLRHAHDALGEGHRGYCVSPYPDAEDCDKGTLMSYSRGNNRLPLFAADGFTKDGDPIGDEDNTAVEHLRSAVVKTALLWELSRDRKPEASARPSKTEEHLCR